MNRPKKLDLYCCEGGGARGYTQAGWDVYGIDLFDDYTQARYPYPSYRGDALTALDHLLDGHALPFTHPTTGDVTWLDLGAFTAGHTSPPCQHASAGTRAMRARGDNRHPALIEPTRDRLQRTGLPYIIENVKGAALHDPVTLCGGMFDLRAPDADGVMLHLERHRLFETSWGLAQPEHSCWPAGVQIAGSYGGGRRAKVPTGTPAAVAAPLDRHAAKYERRGGYVPRSLQVQAALLGVTGMTGKGMHECLPPAYTGYVGRALLTHLSLPIAASPHNREAAA